MCWQWISCLALVLICHVYFVRASSEFSIEWSLAGVAGVNNTFTVEIGDQLTLVCPNASYSNLIGVNTERQYNSCNSSVDPFVSVRRGGCYGAQPFSRLILNIEEASAKLPSDFGFVRGKTTYLTSFSTGADLTSSIRDTTAGGECLSGFRLAVYVKDDPPPPPTATTSAATTTDTTRTSSTTSTTSTATSTHSTTDSIPGVATPSQVVVAPLGISGTSQSHVFSALTIFTCTLITVLLRITS